MAKAKLFNVLGMRIANSRRFSSRMHYIRNTAIESKLTQFILVFTFNQGLYIHPLCEVFTDIAQFCITLEN